MKENNFSPTYFLSALWAWWLSVSFFMYLMFIIPRDNKEFVIPTFDSISLAWNSGDLFFKIVIAVAILGIISFWLYHFKLLFFNIKEYFKYKKTKDYSNLLSTTWEISLMSIPLTLAMTVNVLFIAWAVFVPWLWSIVEYLFPFALLAFFLIWILALVIFTKYIQKIFSNSLKDNISENNSFSHFIAVFAFSMVAVWFSASAAMSTTQLTVSLWLIFSSIYLTIAFINLIIFFVLWIVSIAKNWFNKINSPSIWVIIPILTIVWITIIRQFHWFDLLWLKVSGVMYLVLTTTIIAIQLFFWLLWYNMMKKNWYFNEYISWKEKHAWSFAFICPWVALVVFLFFFINQWLVRVWIIDKYSITYYILTLWAVLLQIKTILVALKLNKKLLK